MNTEAAVELLLDLVERGVEVQAVDGHLRYRPVSAVTPGLRRRIQRHKADLLALLADPEAFAPSADPDEARNVPCACCGGREFWALAHVGHWVCGRCHEPDYSPDQIMWLRVGCDGASQPVRDRPGGALCMSCGGTAFVRLKNGRRSVCVGCEQPLEEDIVGPDVGVAPDLDEDADIDGLLEGS